MSITFGLGGRAARQRTPHLAGLFWSLAFLLALEPAHAKEPTQSVDFSIGPMSLDKALRRFARQSDLQIIFSSEAVGDFSADGVSGVHTISDALDMLLADTGLEFGYTDQNFITVKKISFDSERAGAVDGLGIEKTNSNVDEAKRSGASTHTGEISGRIVSAVTGRPLIGASIGVPDLGRSVFSDENGYYRLQNLPDGDYSVVVTYFGQEAESFSAHVESDKRTVLPLNFGTHSADVILVTGVRSAYENSVNSHRSVDNIVSILDSDLDGRFPDDTIAEALRRAPGISFEREERGGEGQFISIRGLDAAFNAVTINGQTVPPAGLGNGRRVPLDSFLAEATSKIVVQKTLLPHQSSVGIGGAVDIVTTSSLGAGKRRASLTVEGRYSEFADRLGYLAAGEYSNVFGTNDDIGVSASATFRRRFLRTYQFDVLGVFSPESLPIDVNGVPISSVAALTRAQLDADSLSKLEDIRLNVFDDQRDVLALTTGLEWRAADHTNINVTATYNQREIDTTRSSASFEQSDRFVDTNNMTGAPIDPVNGQFFFFGASPFSRQRAEIEDQDRSMLILSAKAETKINRLSIDYGGGYSQGRDSIPLSTEIDFQTADLSQLSPAVLPVVGPVDARQLIFDIPASGLPAPQLSEAGFSLLADPGNFTLRDVFLKSRNLSNEVYSAFVNANLAVDAGGVKNVSWGVQASWSKRRDSEDVVFDDDAVGADGAFNGDENFTLADTSLLTGGIIDFAPIRNPIPGFAGILEADRSGILAFRDQLLSTFPGAGSDELADSDFTESREKTIAGYVSADLELNPKLTLSGGVRVEDYRGDFRSSRAIFVETMSSDFSLRADPEETQSRHTFEVLPRFIASYRPGEKWLIKAGVFESIARPSYSTISRPEFVDIDFETGVAQITTGDPNVQNIHARNYDLSVQYFGEKQNFFEVNLYYKTVSDFRFFNSGGARAVFEAGSMDDLTALLPETFSQFGLDLDAINEVEIRHPIAGVSAEVYGVDASFLHKFSELPADWDGLGMRLSGGVQDTNYVLDNGNGFPRISEFPNAPTFAGTVSLWYEKFGISAYALYSYQSRQLNSVEEFFPDEFVQPYSALDLRVQYRFGGSASGNYSVYVTASDVLDGGVKPTTLETIGRTDRLLDDVEFNGREIRFGIQATF